MTELFVIALSALLVLVAVAAGFGALIGIIVQSDSTSRVHRVPAPVRIAE